MSQINSTQLHSKISAQSDKAHGTEYLLTESFRLDEKVEHRVVIRFISMVNFTSGF